MALTGVRILNSCEVVTRFIAGHSRLCAGDCTDWFARREQLSGCAAGRHSGRIVVRSTNRSRFFHGRWRTARWIQMIATSRYQLGAWLCRNRFFSLAAFFVSSVHSTVVHKSILVAVVHDRGWFGISRRDKGGWSLGKIFLVAFMIITTFILSFSCLLQRSL